MEPRSQSVIRSYLSPKTMCFAPRIKQVSRCEMAWHENLSARGRQARCSGPKHNSAENGGGREGTPLAHFSRPTSARLTSPPWSSQIGSDTLTNSHVVRVSHVQIIHTKPEIFSRLRWFFSSEETYVNGWSYRTEFPMSNRQSWNTRRVVAFPAPRPSQSMAQRRTYDYRCPNRD